ncbi:hypothetical protein DY502_06705 [Salmonella enterica]|nr:hypothetical protein [Salmonella enterica]EDZ8928386.1 hypothetical protein [Salmonella enterica]
MRMNHMSLNRKWILFSLVLVSPAILAAENLNFNYTRAGVLSLEPGLGLQAKACHSKADPMDIYVRFDKNVNMKDISAVRLQISGSAYAKSYTVFSPSVKGRASSDPDFLVPWGAHAKGAVKVKETGSVDIPAVPAHNEQPFCFSNAGPKYYSVIYPPQYSFGGLIPIFKDEPYYLDPLGSLDGRDFSKRCQFALDMLSETDRNSLDYYWPYGTDLYEHRLIKYGDIQGRTGSSFIRDGIKSLGKSFLFVEKQHHIFWSYRAPAEPARTEIQTTSKDYNMDENCSTSSCSFTFPTGKGNQNNIIQDGSTFLVRLNNRNITSLVLNVFTKTGSQTWEWKLKDNNHRNNLYGVYLFGGPQGVSGSYPKPDDPYNIAGFYADKKKSGFYSGTLVTQSALNTTYTNFNKVTPLSLPAVGEGDMNLVNTDSLTFTFGVNNYGSPTLMILGQPLKFAPLTVNGKEVASAMQVRNACY